jgi:broad specificity phosphatase PhoE
MSKDSYSKAASDGEVPLTIYFVRHGQAGGDNSAETMGPPLTRLGMHQAERVGDRLSVEVFRHAYSSDLTRAYETMVAILKRHREIPYTVTHDVREVTHYHFIDGLKYPSLEVRLTVKKEMETIRRFATFLRRTHAPGETVLVVCHGNFIRSILPILGRKQPRKAMLLDINNTAVTIVDVWPSGEAVVKLANCTKHLLPKQIT